MASNQYRVSRSDALGLLAFLGACLVVAAVSGVVTVANVSDWYPGLRKPPFNPPNWLFGPVWSVLYTGVAVGGWRVWRRRSPADRSALSLYAGQLALNFLWSLLFFGLHRIGLALIDILALLLLIVLTARAFWSRDRVAGALFFPYALWVGFAALLNFAIWRLN